jgi:hypothetical protein
MTSLGEALCKDVDGRDKPGHDETVGRMKRSRMPGAVNWTGDCPGFRQRFIRATLAPVFWAYGAQVHCLAEGE